VKPSSGVLVHLTCFALHALSFSKTAFAGGQFSVVAAT